MDNIEFYKNFNMGRELDVCGTFIYNGICDFYNLEGFSQECDVFHVLYNLSVGIERIQKILIVLYAELPRNISEEDIEIFEKRLITHSHQKLHEEISKYINLNFNAHQTALLQLLTRFYKSCRYERYNISYNYHKERDLFVNYLTERLKLTINVDCAFGDTPNNTAIKKFFLKVVGLTVRSYYNAICEQSHNLRIYTYETRYDSAAYKVFLGELKDESFYYLIHNERIATAEFFLYLLNHKSEEDLMKMVYNTESLDLDLNEIEIYFANLLKAKIPSSLLDSVSTIYEDIEDVKSRISLMEALIDT